MDLPPAVPVFKVVVVGAAQAGKTALVRQLPYEKPHEQLHPTVGVDFVCIERVVGGRRCKLQVWDTAGAARYAAVVRAYYHGARVLVAVVDLADLSYAIEMAKGDVSAATAAAVRARLSGLIDALALPHKDAPLVCVVGTKRDTFATGDHPVGRAELIAECESLGGTYYDATPTDRLSALRPFEDALARLMAHHAKLQAAIAVGPDRPLAPAWARNPDYAPPNWGCFWCMWQVFSPSPPPRLAPPPHGDKLWH